jgi:hypothetical protein
MNDEFSSMCASPSAWAAGWRWTERRSHARWTRERGDDDAPHPGALHGEPARRLASDGLPGSASRPVAQAGDAGKTSQFSCLLARPRSCMRIARGAAM